MGRTAAKGQPPLEPGRPRDDRIDAAVLAATRALLVEVGYDGLTMHAVAERAGVGRPSVYRRWSSKAELVHEAAFPAGLDELPGSTGSLAEDLTVVVRGAIDHFAQPYVSAAVAGLLSAYQSEPELRDRLAKRITQPARRSFTAMLSTAVERGEAREGVDADALFDMLSGAVIFRISVGGRRSRRSIERGLVDSLLHAVRPD
jgi:AcrR family transcriptional regulator